MTLRAQRFRLAATIAFMLELLSLLSGLGAREGFGLVTQGQADCTITVQQGESIQGVIDVAQEGAVICLEAGVWEENIEIQKSITLRGAGQEQTIIKGIQPGVPIINIQGDQAIKVTVADFTVTEAKPYGKEHNCAWPQGPTWICPNGIAVRGAVGVEVRNMLISSNSSDGIWAMDSAQVAVFDTVIFDNASSCVGTCMGIDMSDSAQVTVYNSIISKNRMVGITVRDSAKAIITNSEISSNGEVGLLMRDSAVVSLIGSTISDNRWGGLWVDDSAVVSLSDSVVSDNKWVGISALGFASVSLSSSIVSSNGWVGLGVLDSATVSLADSTVSNNMFGLGVFDLASISLARSTISDNVGYGLGIGDFAHVEVHKSTIVGNGTAEDCAGRDWFCNGITASGESQVTITESQIINNADWGLAAILSQCGYSRDVFFGTVILDDKTVIEGNNTTGNQNGMGNPGSHPWNRPEVSDGQVCLP